MFHRAKSSLQFTFHIASQLFLISNNHSNSNGCCDKANCWQASGDLQQEHLLHEPYSEGSDMQLWCQPYNHRGWQIAKWATSREGIDPARLPAERAGGVHRTAIYWRCWWSHKPQCSKQACTVAPEGQSYLHMGPITMQRFAGELNKRFLSSYV